MLVVDDDDGIREVLLDALIDDGYEIRGAADGREALDVLRDWRPDLILLDLMMPGMDGWAFRAEQRRLGGPYDVPVALLSASRNLEAHARVLAAIAAIAKPFDLDNVLATVARLIRPIEAA